MESGIQADILVCAVPNTNCPMNCAANLPSSATSRASLPVIQSIDVSTIYEVLNLMLEEGLDVVALKN